MMSPLLTLVFSVLAAVMLFLFGLAAFSEEIATLGGERLRGALRRMTRSDWRGALIGAFATAVVQSSSAVTSMALGLSHNRTLTARGAFAVMVGANVGTTLTAWLIALKVEGLGPVFVTLGGLWSLMGLRPWRPYGKALFYFGLIFLALDLISQGLAPVARHPAIAEWHGLLESPALALLFGAALTALVQSSSVVSGLAVLTVADGLLQPDIAVWLVAGANVGTTSTALLASAALNPLSGKLALLNTLFNVLGVLLFATLLQPAVAAILATQLPSARQIALIHTLFNITAAAIALLILPRLWPRVEEWLMRESAYVH